MPVFYLDKMHWHPGWVLSEQEDVVLHLDAIMERDTWIIGRNDGSSI